VGGKGGKNRKLSLPWPWCESCPGRMGLKTERRRRNVPEPAPESRIVHKEQEGRTGGRKMMVLGDGGSQNGKLLRGLRRNPVFLGRNRCLGASGRGQYSIIVRRGNPQALKG